MIASAWRPNCYFLALNVLRYYKGLHNLVHAALSVDAPITIAGSGHEEAYLRALVRAEAFGLALVEAAMAGRPMISCDIGTGTSFINRDGETDLIVPPNDPDSLPRP